MASILSISKPLVILFVLKNIYPSTKQKKANSEKQRNFSINSLSIIMNSASKSDGKEIFITLLLNTKFINYKYLSIIFQSSFHYCFYIFYIHTISKLLITLFITRMYLKTIRNTLQPRTLTRCYIPPLPSIYRYLRYRHQCRKIYCAFFTLIPD